MSEFKPKWRIISNTSKIENILDMDEFIKIAIDKMECLALQTKRIGLLLEENGCNCDCDHSYEEHNETCERCLACKIQKVIL